MKYLYFIGFLYLWSAHVLQGQTNPNEPNVLLIIADDMGVDALNGYLNSPVLPQTPTLDSLRNAGLNFVNAWASPVCTPTRANIMSAKYGNKTGVLGVPGNLDTVHTSLFQSINTLTNDQYATAVIGKWHISNPSDYNHPSQLGVGHYEGFFSGGIGNYFNWTKVEDGVESTITDYATAHLTTEAIDWVNDQNQPWFLWLAHATPHTPFHVPPSGTYVQSPTNTNFQRFMAMIENLDYELKRLFTGIPADVLSNTFVIFIGDNGTGNAVDQNYPPNHAKGSVYQGGISVPFMMAGPPVSRVGEVESGLVHVVDIHATILDVLGANLPGGVHNSLSLIDALSTSNTSLRKYNYSEVSGEYAYDFAIRNETYKLIQFEDGTQEFYNLLVDTFETNNIIQSLTVEEEAIKLEFENEALTIQSSWSCQDSIQNGAESSIDCGANTCFDCVVGGSLPCNEDSLVTCVGVPYDTSIIAENYVESTHVFEAPHLRFWASKAIELKPGFEYSAGHFEAAIEDCIELGIDDSQCQNSNATNTTNIGCCATPAVANEYSETISGALRIITSNNFPNHDYCYSNGNNQPSPVDRTFEVDAVPTLVGYKTSILSETNRPQYFYGVAENGVIFAPSPAQPFIFENPNTGEYNWDWVFEPTNVQGTGAGFVSLDCASAHTGPQGYHYHGNMFQYVEEVIEAGISTTTTPPAEPIFIGWAADGFPIVYRFGPDASGTMKLLQPSYQLKYGNRPGDGVTAPCGSYNGRYTNDYRYVDCSGDLDECNGIEQSITLTTDQGQETFSYYYVITDAFPQIGRCFSGIPNDSFD